MYSDSIWSLVVPFCVILLVVITRNVILSLLVGIVVAGFMMRDGLLEIAEYVFMRILEVFFSDGEVSWSSLYVFGFLIVLGILTQIMYYSGSIAAFVGWARKKIKTARASEFLAFIAGVVIFIDDYFNALAVGQISKTINDANHSTRERLAYIIDSTAAPICILMPLSSWGAYNLGLMSGLVEGQSTFSILLASIWSNYYAWFAILGVFLTIYWQINLPAMQKNQNVAVKDFLEDHEQEGSSLWMLIIPIASLIVFIVAFLIFSGYQAVGEMDLIKILAETETGFSLFWGGMCALGIALACSWKQLQMAFAWTIAKEGFMSMLPANLILICAWAIGPVIKEDLQTGIYIANVSKEWLMSGVLDPHMLVPLITFCASGLIAFCTGTSWGTFAIMLPIGVAIAATNETDMILAISAVLAGAVYGDHASPISDTTILSATGAGCSVQSHFITQLPYATSVAAVAWFSFGIAGLTGSVILGYILGVAALIGLFYFYKRKFDSA